MKTIIIDFLVFAENAQRTHLVTSAGKLQVSVLKEKYSLFYVRPTVLLSFKEWANSPFRIFD